MTDPQRDRAAAPLPPSLPPPPPPRWRVVVWGGGACLLMLPGVAMQFTDELRWDAADFIAFGALLAAACGGYELAARHSAGHRYRLAAGLALATAFVLVWANLAVGLIGDERHPANFAVYGVLAIAIAGAALARGRPAGLARALTATALAQALLGAAALSTGSAKPLVTSLLFVALWLASAALFRRAA